MAFNNTLLERTVHGNMQVQIYSCVADGATGFVTTGFNSIINAVPTPRSMATAGVKFKYNIGVSGTATAGTVAITGAATGDEFYLMVYGR